MRPEWASLWIHLLLFSWSRIRSEVFLFGPNHLTQTLHLKKEESFWFSPKSDRPGQMVHVSFLVSHLNFMTQMKKFTRLSYLRWFTVENFWVKELLFGQIPLITVLLAQTHISVFVSFFLCFSETTTTSCTVSDRWSLNCLCLIWSEKKLTMILIFTWK